MDMIGDPLELVRNLKTGFVNTFKKPKEGFKKGPLEGFKGILKG